MKYLLITTNVFFSEEVTGGKKANGKMRIEVFGHNLLSLNEGLEMILLTIDEEAYERIDEKKINVT